MNNIEKLKNTVDSLLKIVKQEKTTNDTLMLKLDLIEKQMELLSKKINDMEENMIGKNEKSKNQN